MVVSKTDCENSELKLADLQAKNEKDDSEDWENKLKALQGQFAN